MILTTSLTKFINNPEPIEPIESIVSYYLSILEHRLLQPHTINAEMQ